MNYPHPVKSLHLFLIAALVAVLTISMAPVPFAHADTTPPTSDLVVTMLSVPKHLKACEVFEATFQVTNLGPEPAYHLYYWADTPDELDLVSILRAPESLAVGESAVFSVVVKVTGYVVKKTTIGWFGAGVRIDPSYLDSSLDPNLLNNQADTSINLISKPVMNCFQ